MREQLNSQSIRYQVAVKKPFDYEIEIKLNQDEAMKLADFLDPLLKGKDRWLRLPEIQMDGKTQAWVLYWRLREGESRLLLAHPYKTEWLGTLALQHQNAEQVIDKIRKRESFALQNLFPVNSPSNFHVVFSQE